MGLDIRDLFRIFARYLSCGIGILSTSTRFDRYFNAFGRPGGNGILSTFTVVIRNKVFEWWKKCPELQGVREAKWYLSNRAIFEQFPVRVNPYFVSVEANKMLHYLTGSIELENTGTTIKPKE